MSNTPASSPRRVLVTGSAGALGQPTCRELAARGHVVRGFDRRPTPNVADVADAVVAELTDRAAIDYAMRDIDSVVHLAAVPTDRPFIEELLPANVTGLFHIMDSAREAGVTRMVIASSCQAVNGRLRDEAPVPADAPAAPTNHYGLTKAWAEQMGEMYARRFDMSVVAVRIGWLPRETTDPATIPDDSPLHDLYLSPGDAGRFFTLAVEAEFTGYHTLNATGPGRASGAMLEIDSARRLIGYEPRDRWPEGFHLLPEGVRGAGLV